MSHEAIHRFNYIVELLTSSKEGLTVSEIERRLSAQDFEAITTRRLRTLLRNMSEDPYLDVQESGSKYRSRWKGSPKTTPADVASMSSESAVRLALLADTDFSQVLPKSIRDDLQPEFEKARNRIRFLRNIAGEQIISWVDRVRLRRPSVRLAVDREEPEIDVQVENAVHTALIMRRPIRVSYFSGHLSEKLEATVYPIGLDCQLRWVTLVCQFSTADQKRLAKRSRKYADTYVQLPLHRIQEARVNEDEQLPAGFDSQVSMADYQKRAEPDRPRGGKGLTQGKVIELRAMVSEPYANDLLDSPLLVVNGTQKLTRQDGGWYLLEATVIQSDNLLWWCASMAGDMIVLQPQRFRRSVEQFLVRGAESYNNQQSHYGDQK